ncbi:ubiquitin-conjugating enzyme E2 variant 3-like [Protopterus annectens]|uniref:ubiquitin-conjugating enzyme E2 variant 3-like n=1 Tax=Protopterus annectens TaxID=7888 RepID=UPI001CFA2373|nr:ubiquitin-conjugating enzyme E2 variant 3-like [Protopterus annectens]
MDFSEDILRRRLVKYKFRDLTIEELMKVHKMYPSFKPSMDTYTFSDGSQKDLLNLIGTIPVNYQGQIFNIPVRFWILDSYPFAPPICFLKPTSSMVIREGKHVDAQGRIYLHYLHSWKHKNTDITCHLYQRPLSNTSLKYALNRVVGLATHLFAASAIPV